MKAFGKEFLKRGLVAAAGGPVILAVIYGILGATGVVEYLIPAQVCMGVLSVTLMAFIAAGITAVYQAEQLPLLSAMAIHGVVLYLDYLVMYLLNDWIPRDLTAIGIFSAVFAVGFVTIEACIYISVKKKTDSLNSRLQKEN